MEKLIIEQNTTTGNHQEILTAEMLNALNIEFYYMMAQDSCDRLKDSSLTPYSMRTSAARS